MHVHIKPLMPIRPEPQAPIRPANPAIARAYASLSALGQDGGRGGAPSRRRPDRRTDEPGRADGPHGSDPASALAILLVTRDLDAAT